MNLDMRQTENKKVPRGKSGDKVGNFFQNQSSTDPQADNPPLLEAEHESLIEEHSRDVLMAWEAPEFETYERDKKWHLIAMGIFIAIISYAVITNSPIMAITFILVMVVGYIYLNKIPRQLNFYITHDGVAAGKEIYEFENIESFWIFYDPPRFKILSLKTKHGLVRHVHIPVADQNPAEIRHTLMHFIPEEKQEFTLIDTLQRVLHI